ncbi:tail fiber assembly protein [Sodalis endosymbiont of Spalangia cameroni]
MEKMKFSAKTAGFYLASMIDSYKKAGSLPDDLIDIDDKTYAKYCRNPPKGKTRGADSQGCPAWVDAPPQTPEEARRSVEFMKQQLMGKATRATVPLQDAVDLDMATDAEKALLLAWKKYRVLLNRVDISTAPDIHWPTPPE